MKIYVPLSLTVFLTFALFAKEEVHSFYISNHDQSPLHRVIHPIVGKTNFVYDAKGALENRIVGEDGMVIKSPKFSTAQSPHHYQLETKLFYVGNLVDAVTTSFTVKQFH